MTYNYYGAYVVTTYNQNELPKKYIYIYFKSYQVTISYPPESQNGQVCLFLTMLLTM